MGFSVESKTSFVGCLRNSSLGFVFPNYISPNLTRTLLCFFFGRLWGTFLADVVIQMIGTDYARILRAIYAFAQVTCCMPFLLIDQFLYVHNCIKMLSYRSALLGHMVGYPIKSIWSRIFKMASWQYPLRAWDSQHLTSMFSTSTMMAKVRMFLPIKEKCKGVYMILCEQFQLTKENGNDVPFWFDCLILFFFVM